MVHISQTGSLNNLAPSIKKQTFKAFSRVPLFNFQPASSITDYIIIIIIIILIIILTVLCCLQDLSSLTKDPTWALSRESAGS